MFAHLWEIWKCKNTSYVPWYLRPAVYSYRHRVPLDVLLTENPLEQISPIEPPFSSILRPDECKNAICEPGSRTWTSILVPSSRSNATLCDRRKLLDYQASFLFSQETLSRSCRIPGLAIRTEQRSYSSLPRSQQRAIGSRNMGTGGTGIIHDSTDCSGNSGHHSLKQNAQPLAEHLNAESTRNNVDKKGNEDIGRLEDSNEIKNKDVGCCKCSRKSRPARYATVKLSNASQSEKKWWRLLKWFPGLKSLKLAGRSTCTVPENSPLRRSELRREEISMTLWNETNEQNTVWVFQGAISV